MILRRNNGSAEAVLDTGQLFLAFGVLAGALSGLEIVAEILGHFGTGFLHGLSLTLAVAAIIFMTAARRARRRERS